MKNPKENIRFTSTEVEILGYIKNGFSSSQIAQFRNCSKRTIEKHRSNIIAKLEIPPSQNALLLWMLKNAQKLDT